MSTSDSTVTSRRWTVVVTVLLIAALAPITAQAATAPAGGRFFDDDGSVHEPAIEAIAETGITKGCNPPYQTGYCPKDPVTRGQMAAFLVRALGLTGASGGNSFVDDDASIFESQIEILVAAGITKGCNPPTNDHFCPNEYVTRGQMAAFLVRALGYTGSGAGDLFTDDDGSIFADAIDKLATAGITKGCNPPANTKFCPDDLVTREEMATFLARGLGLSRPEVPERPIESDGRYVNVWGDAGASGCDYHDGERCLISYDVSGEFHIGTGWYATEWSKMPAADQSYFKSDSVYVYATFDEVPLPLHYWGFEVINDIADKWWTFVFPEWLDGTHVLEVVLVDERSNYEWTVVATLHGDGLGYPAPATAAPSEGFEPVPFERSSSGSSW